MNYHIDIQHACVQPNPINDLMITHWVQQVLTKECSTAELTLRFVEPEEMIALNQTYRQQNKTTNVLAFPVELPTEIKLDYPLLGDIIICPAVLQQESVDLNQPLQAHWAHIIIHGVLHLLGYDHIEPQDAKEMQALEIHTLAELGFANPYEDHLIE